MVQALAPAAAKTKYQTAYKKAKSTYDTTFKNMAKYQQTISAYKKKIAATKSDSTKKALESRLKKVSSSAKSYAKKNATAKANYSDAKRSYSRYKKSPEVEKYHEKNVRANMKKLPDWEEERAYIMPTHAWTDESFVMLYIVGNQPNHESTIPTTSVERGFSVAANSQMTTPTTSVTGYLGGHPDDTRESLMPWVNRLYLYTDNATEIIFGADEGEKKGTITNFSPDLTHDIGSGGTNAIQFSMTVMFTQYADSNTKVKKGNTTDTGKTTKSKGTSKGKRYHSAKSGESLVTLAKKTKYTLAYLKKMNPKLSTTGTVKKGTKVYY